MDSLDKYSSGSDLEEDPDSVEIPVIPRTLIPTSQNIAVSINGQLKQLNLKNAVLVNPDLLKSMGLDGEFVNKTCKVGPSRQSTSVPVSKPRRIITVEGVIETVPDASCPSVMPQEESKGPLKRLLSAKIVPMAKRVAVMPTAGNEVPIALSANNGTIRRPIRRIPSVNSSARVVSQISGGFRIVQRSVSLQSASSVPQRESQGTSSTSGAIGTVGRHGSLNSLKRVNAQKVSMQNNRVVNGSQFINKTASNIRRSQGING